MGQDPFINKLLQRERDEHTPLGILGSGLLWGAIPFFTFEICKLAFFFVASGRAIKFHPIMSWPVAIAAGLIVFSILTGFAITLPPKRRAVFSLILLAAAILVEVFR